MGRKKKEVIEKTDNDLDKEFSGIEKKYGKGSIMYLGSGFKINVPSIPTGSMALDEALGIGGIPRGRIIEIFGTESAGKTTLCLSIAREAQLQGLKCAYIDVEHAFDPDYAVKNGVDKSKLVFSQPDTGEQALDIVQTLVESKKIGLIIIDSVASLVPQAELEGEMEDNSIALQARLMSKALRKLAGIIEKTNTCVIFVNQIREKIGVRFGSPITTPGGRALKFYSSVRIDLRRTKTLTSSEKPIGIMVRAKVVKNKVAPPFLTAEFKIYFDEGLSKIASVLDMALKFNIIEKNGAWFTYKKENIAHGMTKLRKLMKDESKRLEQIYKEVLEVKK